MGALAVLLAWFLLATPQASFSEALPAKASPPRSVDTKVLEARIREVEATKDIEEASKSKLVEFYRKALSNLQTARSNAEAVAAFRKAAETAPAEILVLQEENKGPGRPPPDQSLEAYRNTPLSEIDQLFQKEKADLAAANTKLAEIEKPLESESNRPARIQQQLAKARQSQQAIATQLKLVSPTEEQGAVTVEARTWALETDYEALNTEIEMLDAELASQPLRVDLLKAQLDQAAVSTSQVGARTKSRTQLEELGVLPEQVWRILSPRGWIEVMRALMYQATHSPAFVLLILALGTLCGAADT